MLITKWLNRSKKSDVKIYLKRQDTDRYVQLAREHNYRARSAFKLMEFDDRFRFFKPGRVVIDIGGAPGSWSQVAAERLNTKAHSRSYILCIDLQPIHGVDLLDQSDIRDSSTHDEIRRRLGDRKVDVILSDMAPNPTGDAGTDHLRLIDLCRTVHSLTQDSSSVLPLSPRAMLLCKIWNGPETASFMDELRARFSRVRLLKPEASRDCSSEMYILASSK